MSQIIAQNRDLPRSDLLLEANDAVCFFKPHCEMELQAVGIFQLAIAGKLRTALFILPFFTAHKKLFCIAAESVLFQNKNPFQVSYGRCLGPLDIISSQLALCKSNGFFTHIPDKTDGILRFRQFFKFVPSNQPGCGRATCAVPIRQGPYYPPFSPLLSTDTRSGS